MKFALQLFLRKSTDWKAFLNTVYNIWEDPPIAIWFVIMALMIWFDIPTFLANRNCEYRQINLMAQLAPKCKTNAQKIMINQTSCILSSGGGGVSTHGVSWRCYQFCIIITTSRSHDENSIWLLLSRAHQELRRGEVYFITKAPGFLLSEFENRANISLCNNLSSPFLIFKLFKTSGFKLSR